MTYGLGMLGYDDPRTRGLLTLGLSMLANSGPSMQPTSLGQRLGRAGIGAMGQLDQYMQMRIMNQLREKRMDRIDKQLKVMEQAMKQQEKQEKIKERLGKLIESQMAQQMDKAEGPLPRQIVNAYDIMSAGAKLGDVRMLGLGMSQLPRDYQLIEKGLGKGKVLLQYDPTTGQYTRLGQYNPPATDVWDKLLQQQQEAGQQQPADETPGPDWFEKYIVNPPSQAFGNLFGGLQQIGQGLGTAAADVQAGQSPLPGISDVARGMTRGFGFMQPAENLIQIQEQLGATPAQLPEIPLDLPRISKFGAYRPATLIHEMQIGARKPDEMPPEYRDRILRAADRGELTPSQVEYLKRIGWL